MAAIEVLLLIFTIAIILILIFLMVFYFIKFFRLYKLENKMKSFSLTRDEALSVLADTNCTISQKSHAMICLIVMASILVHILINEGGDYDDKAQEEKFKKNIQGKSILEELNNNTGIKF